MKKLIICFISILLIIFLLVTHMVRNNDKYIDNLKKEISKNTEIYDISYLNVYDNYYIVMDNENLYIIDLEYNKIYETPKYLIYENKKNYDIIYKDGTLMYMNDYMDKSKLIYEYYDIHSYELIDKVLLGG